MLEQFAYFGSGPGDFWFIIAFSLIGVGVLVFEIAMLINVIRNDTLGDAAKVMWVIGMLCVDPFVAIAYYFTAYRKVN